MERNMDFGTRLKRFRKQRNLTVAEIARRIPVSESHRRSAGDCQNPHSSGPTDPRPAEGAGAAIRSIPDNLTSRNPLPRRADGGARSE